MRSNVYRIDDVLLRTGGLALGVVALAGGALALMTLAAGTDAGAADGALARHAPVLGLAALCPIALITAGAVLRRRERRIVAIWSLLRQNAVLPVPGLLAHSDFERRHLRHAVRFLNNRGLAHYVWDERSDTIRDGRLSGTHLHLDKCEACGAEIALEIDVAAREIPRCPFCDDPVCVESLEERRWAAIAELRAASVPAPAARANAPARPAFSLGIFAALMLFCWPLALAYACYTWQIAPER